MKTIMMIGLSIISLSIVAYAEDVENTQHDESIEKIETVNNQAEIEQPKVENVEHVEKPAAIKKDFALSGNWQIISYQVIGYPKMSRLEIKTWMNRVIKFNPKMAIMYEKGTMKVCPIVDIQETEKEAEGYFLIGYKVKPHRLGVMNKEIKVTTLTCRTESWFGKTQEFINLSDEQVVIYWDGVLFYLVKRMNNQQTSFIEKLYVMPQSVGTLMPDTIFSQETITATFPNYLVELITYTTENQKQALSHFELYQQHHLKFAIYPNPNTMTIEKIKIFDEQAVMPGKTQLGDSYQKIFPDVTEFIDCQAGVQERQGQTICSFQNMDMIQYIFEPQSIINEQLVSPIEALNQAKLVEVIWQANESLIANNPQSSPNKTNPNMSSNGETENANPQATIATVPLDVESAYKIQEKQLHEVYEQLMTLLKQQASTKTTTPSETENASKATTKANLADLLTIFQTAQTAWVQYRDDNCRLHSTLVVNQTEKANKAFSCLEKITVERIKEIETIFQGLESKTNGS